MALEYLDFITQWPLIIAVLITFFAVKSIFFKGKKSEAILDVISTEMVTNSLRNTIKIGDRDIQTTIWLEKARNITEVIDNLKGGSDQISKLSVKETNLDLNNWQKAIFGWTLTWFGITIFFIVEIILDPVIWGSNWVLLPYFFYYIGLGMIYFLKR